MSVALAPRWGAGADARARFGLCGQSLCDLRLWVAETTNKTPPHEGPRAAWAQSGLKQALQKRSYISCRDIADR
eukprot:COSAG01_NODE_291_length_19378_cov_38.136418_15_plen_74_part_00